MPKLFSADGPTDVTGSRALANSPNRGELKRHDDDTVYLNPLRTHETEQLMMNTLMDCGSHGWLMIAGGVLIYGALALAIAALIKYLFFSGRGGAAG